MFQHGLHKLYLRYLETDIFALYSLNTNPTHIFSDFYLGEIYVSVSTYISEVYIFNEG